MDLGKVAGKELGGLIRFHHRNDGGEVGRSSSFLCRSLLGRARRLWRVVRAVLFMQRAARCSPGATAQAGHGPQPAACLLLHRGKVVGKEFCGLVRWRPLFGVSSSFSCRWLLDQALAVDKPSRSRSSRSSSAAANTLFSATAQSRHRRRDETSMLPAERAVRLGRKQDADASGRLAAGWRSRRSQLRAS